MDLGTNGLRVNGELHDFSDEPEVVNQTSEDGPAIFDRGSILDDGETELEAEGDAEAAEEQAELEADLPQRVRKSAGPKRQSHVTRAEERALIARIKTGEPGAQEALCQRFEGFLIHHVHREYSAWTLPWHDKLTIARLGLIDASIKFDLSSSFRLTTYAKWWIKARFSQANETDGLIDRSVVKRSRDQIREDAEASRANMLGGNVWIRFSDANLDAPRGDASEDGDGEPRDGHDDLEHSDGGKCAEVIEHTLDVEAKTRAILRAAEDLNDRDREFFHWRFVDHLTQLEIAEKRGVTASRIGQLEAALIRKLAITIAKHEKRRSDRFSIPAFGARHGLRRPSARHRRIVRRLHNRWPTGWHPRRPVSRPGAYYPVIWTGLAVAA